VASQFHFWSKLSSGSVLCPEFPRPVVVLFNWAFGGIILLALQQLLLDAATLVGGLIPGGSFSVQDGFRYAMAGLAACLAAIGVMQATRIPPLKDIEVRIQGLPRQFDGYTILQLTDLHISRLFPAAWARAVVERSNILGVDLIAITGDLIDGTLAVRRADVEPLRDLRATDGVYMIPGNHEYYFGYAAWMQHYASMGMVTLENRHVVLERGGGRLVLAGVTDRASRGGGFTAPDIEAAVDGSPDGAPVILLDRERSEALRRSARRGASAFWTYAWWIDRRAGSARRARQCGLCLRPIPGRRNDALREQRHWSVAWIRIASRRAVGTHARYTAPSSALRTLGIFVAAAVANHQLSRLIEDHHARQNSHWREAASRG
jgi:hypothetical protein